MRYLCTECNFVYDESIGLEEEGISPSTYFYELGDNFCCPNCMSPSEHFSVIEEEVIKIDSRVTNETEDLHTPIIVVSNEKIIVTVGEGDIHPMDKEHFIPSVMLYDEYGDLIEEKFLSAESQLRVEFDLQGLDEFEIRVRCNIHGTWGKDYIV